MGYTVSEVITTSDIIEMTLKMPAARGRYYKTIGVAPPSMNELLLAVYAPGSPAGCNYIETVLFQVLL
jgi:hypothetical protein